MVTREIYDDGRDGNAVETTPGVEFTASQKIDMRSEILLCDKQNFIARVRQRENKSMRFHRRSYAGFISFLRSWNILLALCE